ncbi:DUF4260 domain-containing protein [Vagococcus entomophilus]|uniref:DUF4260 domain-containing protein n=1 Tax=Vagococcus entomophilus TaxID=1160095 RepID=A0A430AGS6_9ENTE|nr:DUF4260 domain-containing protein [Vagococcus entomophilus]RSU07083.1 hypothetical protein CBF30_07445 [Vagococcus entomophilus]
MRKTIKLEFFTLFLTIVYTYFFVFNYSGKLFFFLFFVPDVSMVGYIFGNKLGAKVYNLGHNLILPSLLMIGSLICQQEIGIQLSLIWASHIYMDRTMGYGLKYQTGFKQTHLT